MRGIVLLSCVCALFILGTGCGGRQRHARPPEVPEGPPPALPAPPPPGAKAEPRSELPAAAPTLETRGPAPAPGQTAERSPLLAGQPGPRPDSRPTQAPPDGLEWGINRVGFDYTWFRVRPDPALCRMACESDPSCVAFTYVKPRVKARSALCQLKNAVPRPTHDDCCVSGIKTR